jgi:hypothetical protein
MKEGLLRITVDPDALPPDEEAPRSFRLGDRHITVVTVLDHNVSW